jgi:RimJ/RimL family protein N-acetyltransferase
LLDSKNIILRGLEYNDLVLLHKWMNKFELLINLLRIEPSINYFTEKWYTDINSDKRKKIFAIEEKITNCFIGCIGANDIDYIDRKANLYIYIGDETFRGKGYSKEAVHTFLMYMFGYYNFNKIYLEVKADNLIAINLYKKIGFKQEGLFKKEKYMDFRYIDIIRMAILRGDYIK